MEYLDFRNCESTESEKLRARFKADKITAKITSILSKNKAVKLNIFKCQLNDVYLAMAVGMHDTVLIELARKHNFPRGFPMLWIPEKSIRYFGFLPKFSNDDRQSTDNELLKENEDDELTSIRFFKKWSGFLGQLLAFDIDGKNYWTACSKNSASCDSDFVQDAKRLFFPYVNDKLINVMVSQSLHLCAEMMSKNDQTHGSRVQRECPVITVIGKPSTNDKMFIDYLSHTEVVQFCQRFGLPCDNAVTISTLGTVKQFLTQLNEQRDFMDDRKFDYILKNLTGANESLPNVIIEQGTINHSDVLGSHLEGVVMHLTR